MKKYLLILGVYTLFAPKVFAQTSSTPPTKNSGKFNIGLEAGTPDFQTDVKVIAGFSLKYEIPVSQRVWLTLSGGYNSFLNGDNQPSSRSFLPFKAGVKYYPLGGLFLEGQAGIAFNTHKFNDEESGSYFAYAPGIGYSFNFGVEVGVRFEGWLAGESGYNQKSLRLAYRF